jgi:hypothetical protein
LKTGEDHIEEDTIEMLRKEVERYTNIVSRWSQNYDQSHPVDHSVCWIKFLWCEKKEI